MNSLRNQFLIAMPSLCEGIFKTSVTYICEHNNDGAMGIIVNRPLDLSLSDIIDWEELDGDEAVGETPVFAGGPVGLERGFVLHQRGSADWQSTIQVTEEIAMTVSRDILAALARGEGPENFLIALGYAGWGAGQLEQELIDNVWLTAPATADILFKVDVHRKADAAAAQIGVDLNRVAAQHGNA